MSRPDPRDDAVVDASNDLDDGDDQLRDEAPESPPLPDDARLHEALALRARGDNRSARRLLESIEDDAPDDVRAARDAMLGELAPDRFALGVFIASAILVIIVAWLAFRHSASL